MYENFQAKRRVKRLHFVPFLHFDSSLSCKESLSWESRERDPFDKWRVTSLSLCDYDIREFSQFLSIREAIKSHRWWCIIISCKINFRINSNQITLLDDPPLENGQRGINSLKPWWHLGMEDALLTLIPILLLICHLKEWQDLLTDMEEEVGLPLEVSIESFLGMPTGRVSVRDHFCYSHKYKL